MRATQAICAAVALIAVLADRAPADVPDLPTVSVEQHTVHAVPSDAATAPAAPVTMVPREQRLSERILPRPQRHRPHTVRVSLQPPSIAGSATAAGGVALAVDGRPVPLFGVRLAPRDNGALARAALADRLDRSSSVTCTAPPGQEHAIAYVCRDERGVDLGGMLVAAGLARADRRRSYQYVDDESRARERRAGLWR